jgi:hypothetical protein
MWVNDGCFVGWLSIARKSAMHLYKESVMLMMGNCMV